MEDITEYLNGIQHLPRYKGGDVAVESYTRSHRNLTLILNKSGEHIYIICTACFFIHGPLAWKNSDIHIEQTTDTEMPGHMVFVISDSKANFSLKCLNINIQEGLTQ